MTAGQATPPHDLDAEMFVLGAMMHASAPGRSAGVIADVSTVMTPADHWRPAHQQIHEAILALDERGDPVDAVTVSGLLRERGQFGRGLDGVYLHSLIAGVGVPESAAYHARLVRDCALRRRLVKAGMDITQAAYGPGSDAETIADRARVLVEEAHSGPSAGLLRPLDDILLETLTRLEDGGPHGLPTPWADLNDVTGGLAPGNVYVIAGSTGGGKSIMGQQIALHTALRLHTPALLCSMEMPATQVMERLISSEGKIIHDEFTRLGKPISDELWDRIAAVREKIKNAPLAIDDQCDCSPARIRALLREMTRSGPGKPGLLVVDYLQLLTSGSRSENRQAEVAELSRALKRIASEFAIPVVSLAQLNRAPGQRMDHVPQLHDIRESGTVEQDAHTVVLLHRPDYYDQESPRAGEIDMIVAKNRSGPRTTVTAAFQGHYMRIKDMAAEWSASRYAEDAT